MKIHSQNQEGTIVVVRSPVDPGKYRLLHRPNPRQADLIEEGDDAKLRIWFQNYHLAHVFSETELAFARGELTRKALLDQGT